MLNEIKKIFQWGGQTVEIATGGVARQADGAVMVTVGGTTVLVTCVNKKNAVEPSFFPLTINYCEKFYAAGKIPGGFFRREARPTEKETLTARLIDRPLRAAFGDFRQEVQITATVVSYDPAVACDIPAMIGASCAAALAGLPYANGPIAGARIGFVDEKYVLNPSPEVMNDSALDLVVAGTSDAVLMVESEAVELTEDEALGAILFGLKEMQPVIQAINELVSEAGVVKSTWTPAQIDADIQKQVEDSATASITEAYLITDKQQRVAALKAAQAKTVEALCSTEQGKENQSDVEKVFHRIEKDVVRKSYLAGNPRIDGRDTTTVRPIDIKVGPLERTHGSAIFTRGETQALVVLTLGTERDAQKIDSLDGDSTDPFMLHYNFPPYSVGETGFMGSPKRREIGHGKLAKRAIQPIIPSNDDFPYVMRVVSEITESNGSSSMASVCGTTLAMMDAGVPILAPVAGIAMGLIKDGDNFTVLSDILGDEDHLGDMDFKVAGTDQGITALQMDIKISGINEDVLRQALAQAKEGRLHILGEMNKAIDKPREQLSRFAPRYTTIQVKPNKIRDIIGKGGATIRELTESTNTTIEVNDDGRVKIAAVNEDDAQHAIRRIEELTAEAEIGAIYTGQVVKIMDFGAIVTFLAGSCQGLVHISQISEEHVENVTDFVNEGDDITVKVIDIDRQGRVRLSMKELKEAPETEAQEDTAEEAAPSES